MDSKEDLPLIKGLFIYLFSIFPSSTLFYKFPINDV